MMMKAGGGEGREINIPPPLPSFYKFVQKTKDTSL
jgi:hypothetical protein